jgi:topoisomerase-4 subunit B
MLWNYAFLNRGLTLTLNGKPSARKTASRTSSPRNLTGEPLYPIIHLEGEDIESPSPTARTTARSTGPSSTASTPPWAARTSPPSARPRRDRPQFLQEGLRRRRHPPVHRRRRQRARAGARVRVADQDQARLHRHRAEGPRTSRNSSASSSSRRSTTYLHKNRETAEIMKQKIEENEGAQGARRHPQHRPRARQEGLAPQQKAPRLPPPPRRQGQSARRGQHPLHRRGRLAAGSLTATRDVQTQAVFALKGKPLNTYGLTKKVIYENEEFHLLQRAQHRGRPRRPALQPVVIATDADVDGMHIRLLLISFFLQFFPDLIRNNHLYILQTPLFRVRNKKITIYCYSEQEKQAAKSANSAPATRSRASRASAKSPPASSRTSSARISGWTR